jgi:hypothetical protein
MTKKIGIIAAPGLAKRLANIYYDSLPDILNKQLGYTEDWQIETVEDPLAGSAESIYEIHSAIETYIHNHDWDYIVSLTDLPIFENKNVVAVDINKTNGAIIISLPAYGWRPLRKRVSQTIAESIRVVAHSYSTVHSDAKGKVKNKNLQKQFPLAPLKVIDTTVGNDDSVHLRYLVEPHLNGSVRLVIGMTFANNPLNMMRSLNNSVALAFTTGAFGLVFTTMWNLSYIFSELRLLSITIAAIVAMVLWIVVAHQLWEKPPKNQSKRITRLYNFTTIVTLLVSVVIYYITLMLLFLITAVTIIPPDFLGNTIGLSGAAGPVNYIELAWFAASIAIVAGTIGVGLTNVKLVKESTYGYRQLERYKQREKLAQENDNNN